MEHQRRSVTKRVGTWGSVYIIGGSEADGELLPAEQADDLIARFEHEQMLFGRALNCSLELGCVAAVHSDNTMSSRLHAAGLYQEARAERWFAASGA